MSGNLYTFDRVINILKEDVKKVKKTGLSSTFLLPDNLKIVNLLNTISYVDSGIIIKKESCLRKGLIKVTIQKNYN